MDPFTHALASYTLKRAAFPCAPRSTTIAMLIAGAIADIDLLSAYFSPSVFLTFNRTYFHSLVAGLLFCFFFALPLVLRPRGSSRSPTCFFLPFLRSLLPATALPPSNPPPSGGNSARRAAGFPEWAPPFRWHASVKSKRPPPDLKTNLPPAASFDANTAVTSYK